MKCIYTALAIVVLASLISVPLFSFAVHPAGENDASIVGCWRGLMMHKNAAGGVCGMAVIVYLHYVINRGKWYDFALLSCSLIFLAGTRSKTAIGFLIPIIAAGFVYRTLWRTPRGRVQFWILMCTVLIFGVLLAFVMEDRIIAVFSNPKSFTGRVTIWQAALLEIQDHPFFGSGYSSFWSAGRSSTLYHYIIAPFLEFTQHSHNGFIEAAVVSGIPGLILALLASVIVPFKQVLAWNGENVKYRAMLFSIFLFGITENLLETQLYAKDKEIWIIFCSSILLLQLQSHKKSKNVRGRFRPVRPLAEAWRPLYYSSVADGSVVLPLPAPQQSAP